MPVTLEIAAFDLESALAAVRGGADRIELCSAAVEGGVTPSLGLVEAVRAATDLPLWPMLRPRGGDFAYTTAEHALLRRDARHLARAGADGLVWGAVTADGSPDLDALDALLDALDGDIPVAIHRAFDAAADPLATLDALATRGVVRVLTSGARLGTPGGAPDHAGALARLVTHARDALGGRITILPGGGVRSQNAAALLAASGASEIHSAARRAAPPRHDGGSPHDAVDEDEVRRLTALCRAARTPFP